MSRKEIYKKIALATACAAYCKHEKALSATALLDHDMIEAIVDDDMIKDVAEKTWTAGYIQGASDAIDMIAQEVER